MNLNPSYGYNAFGTGSYLNAPSFLGLFDGVPERGVFGGGWVDAPLPESRVVAPSDMMAIGDYPDLRDQDGDITGAVDEPDDYVADRHNRGGNVVFCDAHVEYGRQTNWMRATLSARLRWNNDHQAHPETWH